MASTSGSWSGVRPHEREVIARLIEDSDLLPLSLERIHRVRPSAAPQGPWTVRFLAEGGAMRVFRLDVALPDAVGAAMCLKLVKAERLVPANTLSTGMDGAGSDLDETLVRWMAASSARLSDVAPGLCPRFGGYWRLVGEDGGVTRVLVEEYVEGTSLQRWKGRLDEMFTRGEMSFERSVELRVTLERRAMCAYFRLWDALDRVAFTVDPSSWNVLLRDGHQDLSPVILDLHGLQAPAGLIEVIQRLQSTYGTRHEMLVEAILPGLCDAVGASEARRLLQGTLSELRRASQQQSAMTGVDFAGRLAAEIGDFLAAAPV